METDPSRPPIIVRGKAAICRIDDSGVPLVVDDAAVLVADGRIQAVDSFARIRRDHPDAEIVGSDGHVVCPGFVNAHHHVGLTPLQHGSPDLPLELWTIRRIASRPVDPYLDTLYSAFEMIESGVTTVQHLHGRAPRPVAAVVDAADAILSAYRDIGMRASYSFGLRDQNRLVYGDDQAFIASLPVDLADLARPVLAAQTFAIEESLEVFETLHGKYADSGRLAIQLAPVNLHWCSDAAIARTLDAAKKYAVPMHMHLLETPFQKEYARRRTGTTAVRHLHKLGALGSSMTLGHGVWMSEDDLDVVAETGTCICHNCSSNLRLRSGIAPLNAFRRRRIPVAIGMDEAGINDDRDMLMEMRMVLRMHRVPGMEEADVPSAAEVFRMATEHGAATTPFAGAIGTIEVGKAADLVLFRWDQVAFPYLSEDVPLVDALVQRARSSGVDTVMVDGEVILRDGAFTRIDKAEILGRIARELAMPPTDADRRNRELAARLLVEARRFYAGYLDGTTRDPFYEANSRR